MKHNARPFVSSSGVTFLRVMLAAFLAAVLLIAAGTSASQAGWFTKLVREAADSAGDAGKGGRKAGHLAGGNLDNAAAHIKKLSPSDHSSALAVDITQEGHWRFVNKAGETYTAGTPAELQRAVSTLLPDGTKGAGRGAKLKLFLTEASIFKQRALLKDVPKNSALHVVVGRTSYPLITRGSGDATRVFAVLKPNLTLEMASQPIFAEGLWQMRRLLQRGDIRVLSLQPGETRVLPTAKPRGKTGNAKSGGPKAQAKSVAETADPFALAKSMSSIRGQSIVISGRLDKEFLHFKPASGNKGAVRLALLRQAAREADVNLIVLNTKAGAQAGSRNWLWQRANVRGLDRALRQATMADFLSTLGGSQGRLVVNVKPLANGRVHMETRAMPRAGLLPSTDGFTDALSEGLSSLAGEIASSGISADMRSEDRQRDLDLRLIPGLPSSVQIGYLIMVLAGLLALPVARNWWRRLWPLEERADYAGRFGFHAARLVRGVVFVTAFLPLTAPLTLPVHIAKRAWHWITAPLRAWRWLRA